MTDKRGESESEKTHSRREMLKAVVSSPEALLIGLVAGVIGICVFGFSTIRWAHRVVTGGDQETPTPVPTSSPTPPPSRSPTPTPVPTATATPVPTSTPVARTPLFELTQALDSDSSSTRSAAVAEIAARTAEGDPERVSAIAALADFVGRADHSKVRVNGRIPEVSRALKALADADTDGKVLDLSDADLLGLEVHGIVLPASNMLRCNLSESTITDSKVVSVNSMEADFESAWLGGCDFQSVEFADSDFSNVRAPGTRFQRCQFSNCDVTSADFSTSIFEDCDFYGARFSDPSAGGPVKHEAGSPPTWPAGVDPEMDEL